MLVAPSLPPRGRRRAGRLLGSVALILTGAVAFLMILQNFRQGAAPRLVPSHDAAAPPPAIQVKLERVTYSYLAALRRGDYAHALDYTIASFRRHQTPARFAYLIQNQYGPTTDVRVIRRWEALMAFDGHQAEAIMLLQCHNGVAYQTVMQFQREGDLWRISNVFPPVPALHPGLPMPPGPPGP